MEIKYEPYLDDELPSYYPVRLVMSDGSEYAMDMQSAANLYKRLGEILMPDACI